jgi:hypothetical protein
MAISGKIIECYNVKLKYHFHGNNTKKILRKDPKFPNSIASIYLFVTCYRGDLSKPTLLELCSLMSENFHPPRMKDQCTGAWKTISNLNLSLAPEYWRPKPCLNKIPFFHSLILKLLFDLTKSLLNPITKDFHYLLCFRVIKETDESPVFPSSHISVA